MTGTVALVQQAEPRFAAGGGGALIWGHRGVAGGRVFPYEHWGLPVSGEPGWAQVLCGAWVTCVHDMQEGTTDQAYLPSGLFSISNPENFAE